MSHLDTVAVNEVSILAPVAGRQSEILTVEAKQFLVELHLRFEERRRQLLEARAVRQAFFDSGGVPDFLPDTIHIRQADWQVAPIPADLQDRRVEITGPVDRKMIINALNSGAKVFMADFEDASSPTWSNMLDGQVNLKDAVEGTISYTGPEGKMYQLQPKTATLLVRPRGWHLLEKHFLVGGAPISGALFDFGLYVYHNAHKLLQKGSGPYLYLPKLEQHHEALLWNDVFDFAEAYLNLPTDSIKATVLIETITAVFELDEILHALRRHIVGLNCGRWDYIFSYIKKFNSHADKVLPDRSQVTMTVPMMQAYTRLVINTCHKRGAAAIGGMSAFIPVKGNEEANQAAIEKVRQDKLREVLDGHDGTWVAHPALVPVAMAVFDEHMPTPNQIHRKTSYGPYTSADLLVPPQGSITEQGVRNNINVAILYIESWLNGVGAAALYGLMEDAATAEISRAQLWQWLKHACNIDGVGPFTPALYEQWKAEELIKIKDLVGEQRYSQGKFDKATQILDQLVLAPHFEEFLTLPAYELIL